MLTKLLAGKWLYVAAGVLILGLAATVHAYLGKRDELAAARSQIQQWEASYQSAINALEDQQRLKREAEQVRIRLEEKVRDLSVQEVEIVTKIREVYRDREVIKEVPQAVECASVDAPDRIVRVLCDEAGSRSGPCTLREAACRPVDRLSDSWLAG